MAEAQVVAPDPVTAIQAMLDAENPPEKAAEPPAEVEEQPAEEEVPAGPNKQVEGEDAPAEEAGIPLETLEAIELEVTVKGDDGKDVVEKPTVKELREGYMRQKDYSRKTAEVARQRDELGEKTRQAIEGERTQYVQNLQTLHALVVEMVMPEFAGKDMNKLSADDPFEYVRLDSRRKQIEQAITQIQAKAKEVSTKQEADQAQALKQAAVKARETLEADIPGWNDALYQELMSAGTPYGYKPDEVGKWLDPRAIKVLHDANEYRKLKAGKPSADKKVIVAPKVLKPGAAASNTQAQQRHADALKRLQGSGSVQDAAAVILARIS